MTAQPLDPTAGWATRDASLSVIVRPDFKVVPKGLSEIYLPNEGPSEFYLPNYRSRMITVDVTRQPAFRTFPILLSVAGLPTGVIASFDTTLIGALPDGGLVNHVTLTLTAQPGQQLPGTFTLDVQARNGLETAHASLTVHGVIPLTITSVSPSVGWTPVALEPGTEVVLLGAGFTTNSLVQFGVEFSPYSSNNTPRRSGARSAPMERVARRCAVAWPPRAVVLIRPSAHLRRGRQFAGFVHRAQLSKYGRLLVP